MSTSKIRISVISGKDKILNGCESPQSQWVEFQITHPEMGRVAEVSLSMQQFAQMLATNSDASCTIELARDINGEVIKDTPERPKSASEELSENLNKNGDNLLSKTDDLIEDLEEMAEGKSVSKKKVKEALHELKVIRGWQESNQEFYLNEATKKVERIAAEKKIELLNMFGEEKVEKEKMLKVLGFENELLLAPPTENYQPKEREIAEIKDMTKRQVANEIDSILSKFEKEQKAKKGKVRLFAAGSTENSKGVSICYVSYQGSSSLKLEDAKKYLAHLRESNVDNYSHHFQYLKSTKED